MTTSTPTFRFDSVSLLRNLLLMCVSIELLFFALDYHVNYAGLGSGSIRKLFSTSREDSLPAWFSIMQTAMVALTVWLVYLLVRRTGTRWQRAGWLTLALFFSYLAFDDGARIHERVGTAYHEYFSQASATFGARTLELFPSYRWQIVFMPIFASMGVFMFVFLLGQLRGWKPKVVVFLALTCLAGAVALDFLEGLDEDHWLNPYTAIANTWQLDYWSARTFGRSPYATLVHFSKSIEETVEMFAMTLLWVVFLGHFTWLARDLRIRFAPAPACDQSQASAAPQESVSSAVQQAG